MAPQHFPVESGLSPWMDRAASTGIRATILESCSAVTNRLSVLMIRLRRNNTHVTEDLLDSLSLRAHTSGEMDIRAGCLRAFLKYTWIWGSLVILRARLQHVSGFDTPSPSFT
jgi:hypothetical protein